MSIQSLFPVEEVLNAARGTEWNGATAGTNAGATYTKTAETGVIHKITDVDFWTDTDSLLQIKDGSTVIKEWKLDVDVQGLSFGRSFKTALKGTRGNAVSAVIASSTSDCHVSLGGFSDKSI